MELESNEKSNSWCMRVNNLYEEFKNDIAEGNLPGITLEDLYDVEENLGLR